MSGFFMQRREARRRKQLRERFEVDLQHLRALRVRTLSRTRQLEGERRQLARIAKDFAVLDCPAIERRLDEIRSRSQSLQAEEAELSARLMAADSKAEVNRNAAAKIPAKAFDQEIRRQRRSVTAEIKAFWRAKNSAAEQSALTRIETKAAELERMVHEARQVQSGIAEFEKQLAALPREQIALGIGTEEQFQEIEATFAQVRADAARGTFHKAFARLSALRELNDALAGSLEKRSIQAREQVNLWLDSPAVLQSLPEIGNFPARMNSHDIEQWRALRPRVAQLVFQKASEQRARNVPAGDHSSLSLSFEDAANPKLLESFLRAVQQY